MVILISVTSGGDNKLAVILSRYEPPIRCLGQNMPIEHGACAVITYDMNAGRGPKLFGDPQADPNVEERLPYIFVTSM